MTDLREGLVALSTRNAPIPVRAIFTETDVPVPGAGYSIAIGLEGVARHTVLNASPSQVR